jgi:hypothetical protein
MLSLKSAIDAARAGLRAFPGRRKVRACVNDAAADYVCDRGDKKNASSTSSFMENRSYFRELT